MKLNLRITPKEYNGVKLPIVLIHGLFGNLDNLGFLARGLVEDQYQVIQLDVRNHGISPWANTMNYNLMAEDVIDTLDALKIERFSVIGHSMGGKIAMNIPAIASHRIEKIVVIDISPIAYNTFQHENIFSALKAVTNARIKKRNCAAKLMKNYISQNEVIYFLLKSFYEGRWSFNLSVLWRCYIQIIDWQPNAAWLGKALFIKGNNSSYLTPMNQYAILSQFPAAYIHVIEGAGHWVHVEKPNEVLLAIKYFLLH